MDPTTGKYYKLIPSYTAGDESEKYFSQEKENPGIRRLSFVDYETENEKNIPNQTDIRKEFYKTVYNFDYNLKNPGIPRFSFVEHKTENQKNNIQNRTDQRKDFYKNVYNFDNKIQNEEKLLDNDEKQKKIFTTNESSDFPHNDGKQKNIINNNLDLNLASEQTEPNEICRCYKKRMMIINCVSIILATSTFTFCVIELLKNNLIITIGGTKMLQHSLSILILFSILWFTLTSMKLLNKVKAETYKKLFFLGVVVCVTSFSIVMVTTSIFINEVNTKMQKQMKNILINNYGKDPNHSVNKQWDELQQIYKCCGVDDNSTTIYQKTAWFEPYSRLRCFEAIYVPPSCCVNPADTGDLDRCQVHCTGPPLIDHGDENPYLFTQGCYPKVKERLLKATYAVRILSSLSTVFLVCFFFILIYDYFST